MPRKKLLCIVCGQEATHRSGDGVPLCSAHAPLYPDAVPLTDAAEPAPTDRTAGAAAATRAARVTDAVPVTGDVQTAADTDTATQMETAPATATEPPLDPETEAAAAKAELVGMARDASRQLLAIIISVAIAIVAGAIGGGIFYAIIGYYRGEEEALGGGFETGAGIAAVVVAVIAFVLARQALSQRFRRKS